MKDEPTLDPWTDPEAEARIVALLLGEASDFERAEMERLLAEQPELAVFHRRMTVISQLVGEAESKPTPSQQAAWRLAPARREKLLARLGLPSATKANATNPAAKRPLVRHFILIAAGLAACLAVVASVLTPMGSKSSSRDDLYAGEAKIQVQREIVDWKVFEKDSPTINVAVPPRAPVAAAPPPSQPAEVELAQNQARRFGNSAAPSELNQATDKWHEALSEDRDNTAARRNAISAVESAPPTEPQLAQVELQSDGLDRAKNLSVADSFGANVDGFADMTEFASQADSKPGARWGSTDGKALPATETPPSASKPASRPKVQDETEDTAEPEGRGSQVAQQAESSEFARNEALAANGPAAQQSNFQIGAAFTSVDKLFGYVEAKEKDFSTTAPAQPSSGLLSEVRKEARLFEATKDGLQTQSLFRFGGGGLGGSGKDDAKKNQADDSLALNKERALGPALAEAGGGSAVPADRASGVSPEVFARNLAGKAPEPPLAAMPAMLAPQAASAKQLADLPEAVEFEGFANYDAPSQPLGEQPTNSSEALLASADLGLGSFRQLDREAKAVLDGETATPEALGRKLAENTPSKAKAAVQVAKKETEELAQLQAKDIDAVAEAEGSQELEKLAKVQESKIEEARLKMLSAKQPPPAPKPAPPAAQEIQASAEPFSTFSLHVSDVSFKLAHTALVEKSEWPAAEKIRPEEFVNAFDYRDSTPAYAEKVACRWEQAAHPFLPQRNALRIALRTACDGRAGSQALRLTLLVDTSGSMQREDRHATMVRVLQSLAGQLNERDSVSLVGFARTPSLLADRVPGDKAKELADLVARTPSDGGTNLELALQMAEEIATRQMAVGQQNRVILFTDGAANLGDATPESLHAKIVALRQKGIAFDACGVGLETLNDAVLEALTRGGDGRYYALNRPEDAEAGFAKKLAGALRPAARNVKVQVNFNPRRVGAYRLIGFEKHRLNKEDFRNDAVDAAEMSAEEAGVALYQVQAKPDGAGDLGEVSVRFQDTASGLMVERSWVIPYEPNAPAFDQASASLQLATTAGHFAERLRGEEGVPFEPFLPALANIREAFGSDERVGQLTAMFEKARGLAR